MTVRSGDADVGQITSGCLSPTLGHPIAMAYIATEHTEPGTSLNLDLGNAEVVPLPFYQRSV